MEKGNLTEYLDKFQELYSELLKQGNDLYSIGFSLSDWVFALKKIKREDGDYRRLKITSEDAKELFRLFPKKFENEDEIIKEYQIKSYSFIEKYACLSLEGLEEILQGKPAKVHEIDIDIH